MSAKQAEPGSERTVAALPAREIRIKGISWCSRCPLYITYSRGSIRSHLRMKHGVGKPWRRQAARSGDRLSEQDAADANAALNMPEQPEYDWSEVPEGERCVCKFCGHDTANLKGVCGPCLTQQRRSSDGSS